MDNFGILSIVPPLITIAVALYSKNVIVALIVGILSGSLIITGFNPFDAVLDAIENQVLSEFTNGTQAQVIVTMMVIGGFVRLLAVSGGAKAFASKMLQLVSTRAKGATSGLVVRAGDILHRLRQQLDHRPTVSLRI